MAKSKGWLPFSPAWRAKYKEKLRDPKMTDTELQDREVKYRRTLYQTSISSGFYVGAHIAMAAGTSGITVPLAVVQLSWQAFNALQANFKHKLVIDEIYRRGLTPRKMTKAEMAKTAFWASLSVALAQAIDNIASTSAESEAGKHLGNFFSHHPSESMSQAFGGAWDALTANAGETASEAAAQGGSLALSFALDGLAAGGVASAGLAAAAGIKRMASSQWFASPTLSSLPLRPAIQNNTSSDLLVTTRCVDCGARITARITAGAERRCTECQFAFRNKERKAEKEALTRQQLEETDETADMSSMATLHLSSYCDGCLDAIIGTRFTCLDCAEFDLCEDCFCSPDLRLHVQHHRFDEIRLDSDTEVELSFISLQLALHNDVFCDGCNQDLTGLRMRCLVCPYFDLCNACFHGKWGLEHSHEHVFEQVL